MSDLTRNPFDPFFEEIRRIVREEIKAASNGNGHNLLTAEGLAEKLNIHNKHWAYEAYKQGKIPGHKIGRYIRFNLQEVLDSQKEKKNPPLDRL